MNTDISEPTLNELYEKVILPQFGITDDVTWHGHMPIGHDTDVHEFTHNSQEMILVFDDYPTTTIRTLHHEYLVFPQTAIQIELEQDKDWVSPDASFEDRHILGFGPRITPSKYVHNVTGYFQLFRVIMPK